MQARFIEKLYGEHRISADNGCRLIPEAEVTAPQDTYVARARIDVDKIDPKTEAVLLFLDGEPRIFQFINSITVTCVHAPGDGAEGSFLIPTAGYIDSLFQMHYRPHKDDQSLALCVLYKEEWMKNNIAKWAVIAFMEPLYVSTSREKDYRCSLLAVNSVPALERYRPKLFTNIREMCSALSSRSLPKLKKNFMKADVGLNLEQFTTVLFNQLAETHPRVMDPYESGYIVAMIHEMFSQMGE